MQNFTRASALMGYGELAQQAGLDPEALLRNVGLPVSILEQPDGLIPYSLFLRLLDLSATQSKDPFFGIKLGLHQGITIFGPLLYLVRNAPTVGAALQEFRGYFHLHMGAAVVELERFDNLVQLSYHVLDGHQPGLIQGVELAVGVGKRLLQVLCGEQWQLTAALFEHSPHAPLKDYHHWLGVTPQFNSGANALLFEASLLERPLAAADPVLHSLIRDHLDTLERLSDPELPGYVASLLRNMLDQGRVTVDDVAAYLPISRRTLQRRLAGCGTSFQKVLDQTRQNLARRYLRDSAMQMTQLADLLGYSELSAFSRAFTRWFGTPPSQWRQVEEREAPTSVNTQLQNSGL